MKSENETNDATHRQRYGIFIQAIVYALLALAVAVAGIDLDAAPAKMEESAQRLAQNVNPRNTAENSEENSENETQNESQVPELNVESEPGQNDAILEDRILARYGRGQYSYQNTFAVPFTYRLSSGQTVRPLLGRRRTDIGKTRINLSGTGEAQAGAVGAVIGGLQIGAAYLDYSTPNNANEFYPLYAADGTVSGRSVIATGQYTFFRDYWISPLVTALYADRRNRYDLQNFIAYNEGADDYNYYRDIRLRESAIRNEYGAGARLRIAPLSLEVTLYYQYALNRFTLDLEAPSPVNVPSSNLVPDLRALPESIIQNNEITSSSVLIEKTTPDFHFAGIRLDYRPFQTLLLSASVRKNTTTNTWESVSSILVFVHPNLGISVTHLDIDAERLGRSTTTTIGPVFTMKL